MLKNLFFGCLIFFNCEAIKERVSMKAKLAIIKAINQNNIVGNNYVKQQLNSEIGLMNCYELASDIILQRNTIILGKHNFKLLEKLFWLGMDVNLVNSDGIALIFRAIEAMNLPMFQFLLNYGASTKIKLYGLMPLEYAEICQDNIISEIAINKSSPQSPDIILKLFTLKIMINRLEK